MSKTIRVQWEYPDFAYSLGDENYEDFEVDDDATEEEIKDEAADRLREITSLLEPGED